MGMMPSSVFLWSLVKKEIVFYSYTYLFVKQYDNDVTKYLLWG